MWWLPPRRLPLPRLVDAPSSRADTSFCDRVMWPRPKESGECVVERARGIFWSRSRRFGGGDY